LAKTDNKTKPTSVSPLEFVEAVEHPVRKKDAKQLLELFARVTGFAPRMWGPSMIGYGRYHYRYESGREGDMLITGFSPRKSNLVIYIMPGYLDIDEKLRRLGKYKTGKSCLYINKLADIDVDVLAEIINYGVQYMRGKYETWED